MSLSTYGSTRSRTCTRVSSYHRKTGTVNDGLRCGAEDCHAPTHTCRMPPRPSGASRVRRERQRFDSRSRPAIMLVLLDRRKLAACGRERLHPAQTPLDGALAQPAPPPSPHHVSHYALPCRIAHPTQRVPAPLRATERMLVACRTPPCGSRHPTLRRLLGAALVGGGLCAWAPDTWSALGHARVSPLGTNGEHTACSARCRSACPARSRIALRGASCHTPPAPHPPCPCSPAPRPLAVRCGIDSIHPLEASGSRVWAGAAPASARARCCSSPASAPVKGRMGRRGSGRVGTRGGAAMPTRAVGRRPQTSGGAHARLGGMQWP